MKNAMIYYSPREREIIVDAPFQFRDLCVGLSSRRWDKDTKTWRVPATLPALEELLTKFHDRADVDQSVWGVLGAKRDTSASFTEIKDRLDLDPDQSSYQWYTRPMAHQVSGTEAILRRDRVLLLDQMGLGKSKEMIDAAVYRIERGEIKRALIVVPASLKYNWVKEINKHSPPAFRKVTVIGGTPKERKEQFQEAPSSNFVIINYELARKHQKELDALCEKQMLICDEAHKLKNMRAQVTKAIHLMDPKYAVLATGTPIANKPEDIFSLTQFVEKGLLGFTEWQFMNRYCYKGGYEGKQIMGYRNLKDFQERVATISIRRLKENVLDLPPKVYQTRTAQMDGDQLREYQRMRDDMVAFYKEIPEKDFRLKVADARTQILRLKQIANGFIAADDRDPMWFSTNAKMSLLDEIVDEICGNGEKLVVWSYFVPTIKAISERFAQHNPVAIWGGITDKKKRFDMVDRFQEHPDCRMLVGQIHTAGSGFDMTASQTEVFYDLWWSPSINEQAEDRLHRKGTKGTVSVIRLAASESVDQYLMGMLDNKKQWSDVITGDDLRLTRQSMLTLLGEEPVDAEENSGRQPRAGSKTERASSSNNPGRSNGKVAAVRSAPRQVRKPAKAGGRSRV